MRKASRGCFSAARKETHDRVLVRREEARANAAALADRVEKDIQDIGDAVAGQWNALQAKVSADINRLKTAYEQRQHDRSVERVVHHADRLESEAGIAIEFALASIEDAKRAVLDAVVARIEAADARR